MKAFMKLNAINLGSVLLGVIISFFPKCVFCWAAYMSIFSTLGIISIPYVPWLEPLLTVFFLVNVFTLFHIARKRKNYGPFCLSMAGALLIMASKFVIPSGLLTYSGLLMIIAASILNLITRNLACKIEAGKSGLTMSVPSGDQDGGRKL
jgi:hypothetical protein